MPHEAVRRAILEAVHAHGYTDLTPAHFPVVQYPGPQGQRPVDLAAAAGTSKQAMNYLLGQLESFGYLERRVDPEDSRSRRVYLTARGERLIPIIRGAVSDLEAAWAKKLGTAEMEQLHSLLLRLNEIT
jgi:DNA-binding MarR family transcriptional regulator